MAKSIAIFDIDGTIFRSSLSIKLFERLVERGVFDRKFLSRVRKFEEKWLDRVGHYDDYIGEVVKAIQKAIVGKKQSDIAATSREIVRQQRMRTYKYTRNLLQKINKNYFTIAISGSMIEIVGEYNKFLKFDKIYGTEFGVDEKGKYTGHVLHEPPRYKRELIVRYAKSHGLSMKNSIGIGDTESDVGFLRLVSKPIAFNPNAVLAKVARKNNWPIIIERKDLIVEINPKKVKFLRS